MSFLLFLFRSKWTDMELHGSVPTVASTVENGDKNANQIQALETDKERDERFRSLRIIYFTMFLISLGFSIVLTGIWPYLDKVCKSSSCQPSSFLVTFSLCFSSTLLPVKSLWASLLPQTPSAKWFSLHFSDGGQTNWNRSECHFSHRWQCFA